MIWIVLFVCCGWGACLLFAGVLAMVARIHADVRDTISEEGDRLLSSPTREYFYSAENKARLDRATDRIEEIERQARSLNP